MPRQRPVRSPQTSLEVLQEQISKLKAKIIRMDQAGSISTLAADKTAFPDPGQGEIIWNWKNSRAYIRHLLNWYPLEPPTYHIKVFSDLQPVTTGDGKFKFAISRDMHQMYLIDAEAYVTTAGANTITLYNNTQARDLLSSPLVITSLHDTGTRVIHPTNSQVNWKDQIWINVDAAGGNGLGIMLVFAFPPNVVI